MAIAQALMEYEHEGTLFNVGDWYEYFYNLLNASLDEFDKNEIRIITFNYDRSLEHFLFTALLNSYGITEDECAVKMKSIPIIHVHGQLGSLPWQDKTSGRKYASSDLAKDIKQAADGIKIIHEDIDLEKDEKFLEARAALKWASRIYFIGFGYAKENIRRLNIHPNKPMKGTCFGIGEKERERAWKSISQNTNGFSPNRFAFVDPKSDALRFFTDEIELTD